MYITGGALNFERQTLSNVHRFTAGLSKMTKVDKGTVPCLFPVIKLPSGGGNESVQNTAIGFINEPDSLSLLQQGRFDEVLNIFFCNQKTVRANLLCLIIL
jgi:hypothetical protein